MVFSLFMGNFVDMIKEYQTLKSEIGDFVNLSKFFGLMKKFNKGKCQKAFSDGAGSAVDGVTYHG